jgi:hypothetical protein
VQAEQLTDPATYRGDGPAASARWGGLRCSTCALAMSSALGRRPSYSAPRLEGGRHHVQRRRQRGTVIGVERGSAPAASTDYRRIWTSCGPSEREDQLSGL